MKRFLAVVLALLLCFGVSACRNEYVPVVIAPEPTPEPTPEPFDPQKLTLGVYGAPALMAYGFLKTSEELSYNAVILEGELQDALLWAQEHAGLLIYGASEEDRAAINETAAYGCAIVTSFYESAAPKGAKCDISFSFGHAGTSGARFLAQLLNGGKGAVLICRGEDTEMEQAVDESFRKEWQKLGMIYELDELELLPTEYSGTGEDAVAAVGGILSRRTDIAGVFACSADCAHIWTQAVSELEDKPFIAGADATKDTLALIANEQIDAVYSYPYYNVGEKAAQVMDAALRGEPYFYIGDMPGHMMTSGSYAAKNQLEQLTEAERLS